MYMIQGKKKISTNVYLIVHMVKIRVLILTKEMKTVATITFMPKGDKTFLQAIHIWYLYRVPNASPSFMRIHRCDYFYKLATRQTKLSWMSIISPNMQSSCNITSLVTIEQKVKVFREKHTLHMGAYGDLDTNCFVPLFLFLCEIFSCSPILNDANFFYIERFWLSKRKRRWKFIMNLAYSWELWGKW